MDISLLSYKASFKGESPKRKIELVEIDAFRLIQYYLTGRISFEELENYIRLLSNLKLKSEKEFFDYIKSKATYETYLYSNGQSKEERQLLKNRLFKLIDKT